MILLFAVQSIHLNCVGKICTWIGLGKSIALFGTYCPTSMPLAPRGRPQMTLTVAYKPLSRTWLCHFTTFRPNPNILWARSAHGLESWQDDSPIWDELSNLTAPWTAWQNLALPFHDRFSPIYRERGPTFSPMYSNKSTMSFNADNPRYERKPKQHDTTLPPPRQHSSRALT